MLDFVVGIVEQIGVEVLVIALDGEVACLENHGQRHSAIGFVIDEQLFRIFLTCILHDVLRRVTQ